MTTPLPPSIAALLRGRAAASGHRPLITSLAETHDERTELSHATFLNWVGKTANLLSEEFSVGPGDRVALALPSSWTAAVLAAACWTLRACVVAAGPQGAVVERLRVVVSGERAGAAPGWPADAGRMVVGDGMAGRLTGPPVAGALPYGEEVLAYADDAEDTGPALDDDALLLAARAGGALRLDQRTLLTAADAVALAPGSRLLSTLPLDGADGLALGLLGPLVARGALVLVTGTPAAGVLARLAREERVGTLLTDAAGLAVLVAGGDVGGVSRILCPGGAPRDLIGRAEAAGAGVTVDLPGAPGWVGTA